MAEDKTILSNEEELTEVVNPEETSNESTTETTVTEETLNRAKATPIFTNAEGGTVFNLTNGSYDPSGGGGGGNSTDMTIEAMKALMGKQYGLLLVMFDNDEFWYFAKDDDEPINDDNFEVVNGVEFIRKRDYIYSKKGGPNGGIGKADIPVWMYKPISMIQGVMLLENPNDIKHVDRGRLYVL